MEARTYRWAEACLGGYWVLTSLLLMFGPHASAPTIKLALLQFAAAIGLYVFSSWVDRHEGWGWSYWVPWMPLFLWTYRNIDVCQKALGRPLQDATVQGWERAVWGGFSPALEWSQHWGWLPFSEFLHLCYTAYYLMMPLLLIRLLRRQRDDLARLCLCGGVSSLLVCYVVSIFFPVQGPRPLYPPLAEALHGPIWTGCHMLMQKAAAGAAAFPSGHTSLAVATAWLGWTWDRKLFPVYLIWAVGIASATVYGRFHYTVDVMGGLVVGLVCAGMMIYRDPDKGQPG